MTSNCLILGTGYVGTYYLEKFPNSYWTSRNPTESRPTKSQSLEALNEPIYFSLTDKESWENLPDCKNVLWAFAIKDSLEEEELALEFYDSYLIDKNVIVYSSIGGYKVETRNQGKLYISSRTNCLKKMSTNSFSYQNLSFIVIDEDSPIKMENARYRAEEKLRQKGALVLPIAGILGKNRYPKRWIESDWIKEGQKVMNYIHVDDIVTLTDLLFKNFKAAERINLTNGDCKTYRQIVDLLQLKYVFANEDAAGESKIIENRKLLRHLSLFDYQFIKYPEDEYKYE
jgi:hypothetical protein